MCDGCLASQIISPPLQQGKAGSPAAHLCLHSAAVLAPGRIQHQQHVLLIAALAQGGIQLLRLLHAQGPHMLRVDCRRGGQRQGGVSGEKQLHEHIPGNRGHLEGTPPMEMQAQGYEAPALAGALPGLRAVRLGLPVPHPRGRAARWTACLSRMLHSQWLRVPQQPRWVLPQMTTLEMPSKALEVA